MNEVSASSICHGERNGKVVILGDPEDVVLSVFRNVHPYHGVKPSVLRPPSHSPPTCACERTIMANRIRYDFKSYMDLQPFKRNIFYFGLSILALAPLSYLSFRLTLAVMSLNEDKEKQAFFTQLIVTVLFILLCIVSPIFSLRRLYRNHVYPTNRRKSFWSMFTLRNPFRQSYCNASQEIGFIVDNALRHKIGETVSWDLVPHLSKDSQEYVRLLVEEAIVVKRRDNDGTTYVAECSAWLLVFSHLALIIAVLLAANFTAEEVSNQVGEGMDALINDAELGKVLSEWMSNYVLLLIGFLQIVTRGAWFQGFAGICEGTSSTMTYSQRNAIVALYIASAESEIEGLRAQSCYSTKRMTGTKWLAPPTSSLVLASLGPPFSICRHDYETEWQVDWEIPGDDCLVQTVGTFGH